MMNQINDIVKSKNVLFISTKNSDYIRNQQEKELLQECAKAYDELVFLDRSYVKRILKVWTKCLVGKWRKAEVMFVGFAPQLMLPFLMFWNKRRTVIIDFFISMYDTCVCDRHYFKEKSLAAKVLHKIDSMTLKHCSHVIVDTKADRKYFSEEFGVAEEKMEVLYLKADTNTYHPMEPSKVSDAVFHVLYFGSILPLQGIDVILDAVKLLGEEKDIYFTIIGPIKSDKGEFQKEDYPNAEFFEWLSQKELAKKIADADLCLAGHFNAKIGKAKRTIPGKAYIYEAMNKRMILGDNDANREIFKEDDRHLFVKMGDPKALADMIGIERNYNMHN